MQQIINRKHSGKQGHLENAKVKNRDRRRRIPAQRQIKYIQQKSRKKTFPS